MEFIYVSNPFLARGNDMVKGILDSVSIYNLMHTEQVNKSKQLLITCCFTRQATAGLQQGEDTMDAHDSDVMG